MNKYIHVSIIAIVMAGCIFIGSTWQRNKQWTGLFYPNKTDFSQFIISPPLNSLDECRSWVKTKINNSQDYDYECGSGCNTKTFGFNGPLICKKNLR